MTAKELAIQLIINKHTEIGSAYLEANRILKIINIEQIIDDLSQSIKKLADRVQSAQKIREKMHKGELMRFPESEVMAIIQEIPERDKLLNEMKERLAIKVHERNILLRSRKLEGIDVDG